MNKLLSKIAVAFVGMSMAIGVGFAVGSGKKMSASRAAETSYTITFITGSNDGTAGSTSTAMSSYTTSSYVTGNATAATNAYYAGSSGLKLGTSKAGGTLAFNLSDSGQVTATRVIVNAKRYNETKAATIKLGSLATQNLTADFDDYEFALTGALTSLSIESSKYAWVASISVYYNDSTPVADSIARKAPSFDLAVGSTLDLTECVTASGPTAISFSITDGNDNDEVTLEGNDLTANTADASVTISATKGTAGPVTFTINTVDVPEYSKHSGTVTNGDYLVTVVSSSTASALKNTIDSGRGEYVDETVANNKVSTAKTSIVWHIEKSGDYYTLYNSEVEKYFASTGAANKAQLLADGTDDKSLWTITEPSTGVYNIENKYNAEHSVNSKLQKNGTYGFACYADFSSITLFRLPTDDLQSIVTVGQTTSFTAGNPFAFGGSVTATYSISGTSGHTGITSNLTYTLAGSPITVGTTLTRDMVGTKAVVVTYTDPDSGLTASAASYNVTISLANASSVTISQDEVTLGHEEYVDFTATIGNYDYADRTLTWTVQSAVDDEDQPMNDYTFNTTTARFTAGTTNGTVVVRVTGVGGQYDECTITIFSRTINGVTITGSATATNYFEGDALNLTGLDVALTYDVGDPRSIGFEDEDVIYDFYANYDSGAAGDLIDKLSNKITTASLGTSTVYLYVNYNLEFEAIKAISIDVIETIDTVESRTVKTAAYDEYFYEKVTSISEGRYLIVVEKLDYAFNGALSADGTDNYVVAVDSDGKIKQTDALEAAEFTVSATENGYSFKAASNKYIYQSSDNNGLLYNNSEQELTVSFTDGNAYITCSAGAFIRFNHASGQDRFRFMKSNGTVTDSGTGQYYVQLYKFNSTPVHHPTEYNDDPVEISNTDFNAQKAVLEFASYLSTTLNSVCDEEHGNTTFDGESGLNAKWTLIKSKFDEKRNPLTTDEKAVFDGLIRFASADEDGDSLQQAVAAYNYVVGKYKARLTAGDFFSTTSGRDPVNAARNNIGFGGIGQFNSTTLIIIVMSLLGVAAVGGYFFIKKRKENY